MSSSSRLGGDDHPGMYEGADDDELFGEASSVSGGESGDDEEDGFSEGGAEVPSADADQMGRRRFTPRPLRRFNSDGIYDLSPVTAQLPAKKGLSRYYEGKSQSFACMSEVRCLEDLRKKEKPYQHKIESCKSYDANAKAQSASSCANLSMMAVGGFRAPPIPVNKNGYHQ
ncbi:hypothetical protein GUJ93_ZPchr0005g15648 [Zizania palustris]|uniref:Uncharacterized protein n=1 Tax=Zizania palustris TaxID=103762 RepID=A0A8J5S455_ZIZPA|nr:hypothetical protein GUJ93_ZPchr0005g15648 [Zizania palustris]